VNILDHAPPFATLAIGSVPFLNPDQALDLLAGLDIPAAPQMVGLSFWEDMIFGSVDGLPFIKVIEAEKRLVVEEKDLGDNLAKFYEDFYAGDFSFLDLNPKSSVGLRAFWARAKADPTFGPEYLKAQVVGPLTLAQSLRLSSGGSAVDDPNVLEALSLGLGAKAAFLAAQIRKLGRKAIVFVDEPGLTGYGSAFSTLSAQTVLKALGQAVETAKSQGPVAIGCHVCGNTDWGLLAQAGLDILNFDAYSHLEPFCLYPKELETFLAKGGYIAFGLVPTEAYVPEMTALDLLKVFKAGLKPLESHIDPDLLAQRTLFTTSCGLGSLKPKAALAILRLLAQVAKTARGSTL
jgi:hypothetical protein